LSSISVSHTHKVDFSSKVDFTKLPKYAVDLSLSLSLSLSARVKMGKGGVLRESIVKKILLSYTYVSILLSNSTSITVLLVRVLYLIDPVSMSREVYLSSVIPIGTLYYFSLLPLQLCLHHCPPRAHPPPCQTHLHVP
jgi:hypothetical protein